MDSTIIFWIQTLTGSLLTVDGIEDQYGYIVVVK